MATPLSLDTAQFIRENLKEEVEQDSNFLAVLSEFHENHPYFAEDMLTFLETCRNKRTVSAFFFDFNHCS